MRILCLYPRLIWERRVSASRRHDVEALARHPGVSLRMSGAGWPDWDDRATGLENVRRIMPDADAVYEYKMDGTRVSGVAVPPILEHREIGRRYLVVEKMQECHWGDPGSVPGVAPAWQQMVDRRVGLCILSHANDAPRLAGAERAGVAVRVIPHCAEATLFGAAKRPWGARDIPVLLTGVVGQEHYPLRTRWAALAGRIGMAMGLPVRVHPRPPHMAADEADARRLRGEYAELLGRAKLVLGCASKWRYALARFPEAAAAGAVHVSDMPDDAAFRRGLGRHIMEVEAGAADCDLIRAVVDAWDDQAGLRRRSEAAWRQWREELTWDLWAERFVKEVRTCL